MNTNPSGRRVAIVTGSATGVGAATALALSRRGYELLIKYSKSEREAKHSEAACRDAGADTLLVRGNAALILSGGMLLLWQGHAERKARRSQVTPPQG